MVGLKRGIGIIFILLLIVPFICAETIVVQQEKPPEKQGFFATYFGFLKSPIFWYIFVGALLFIGLLVGLFFFIRWLLKYLKARSDIFWKLRSERIKLSKIQRRYPSKSWWKVHKNTPIRLVRKEDNGKLLISHPVAYHRGDYITHEGNVIISMNLKDNKKYFFFPITDLLVIPNKEKISFQKKNEKGKIEIIEINNLPQAKDIIQFNENEILIFAESLSSVGMFIVPVLKAKDGKIIDLSLPVYQSLKEVIIGEYLYQQSDDFVKVARKSIDLNPNLRFQMKAGDTNQNVEIPSNSGGNR